MNYNYQSKNILRVAYLFQKTKQNKENKTKQKDIRKREQREKKGNVRKEKERKETIEFYKVNEKD